MQYAINENGYITFKSGETPFPVGSIWPIGDFINLPVKTIKIVAGQLVLKGDEEIRLESLPQNYKKSGGFDEYGNQIWIELAPEDVILEPEPPYNISKLKLKRAMGSLGKWQDFLAILKSNPDAYEDFNLAITLMSDDPLVIQFKTACIQLLGVTEEQLNDILKSCVSDI
jgi:hypothetical protein